MCIDFVRGSLLVATNALLIWTVLWTVTGLVVSELDNQLQALLLNSSTAL